MRKKPRWYGATALLYTAIVIYLIGGGFFGTLQGLWFFVIITLIYVALTVFANLEAAEEISLDQISSRNI